MYTTIPFEHGDVKLVAHRGCSGLELENTASAFVAAGNRSYWGIETDVHVTSDGELIVIHDDDTVRVTGDSMIVEKTTFNTLRNLRMIDKDGTYSRADLMLPTLAEYASICKKYGKVSVLELKNHMKPADIDKVIATVREVGQLENTVFISFDLQNMICIREKLPEQPAQFLISDWTDWLVDTLVKYHLDLDIKYKSLTAERAAELTAAGVKINVWTVDQPEVAQRMKDYGVSFITTDIIE